MTELHSGRLTRIALVGAVVLDHIEDPLARGASERLGQVAAYVVLLHFEHLDEAGRRPRRRLLHERYAAVQDVLPGFAEEDPEGLSRRREGLGGSTLRIGEPHVPVPARLAGDWGSPGIAVRDLHVVLPFQPAPAVGHDPREPIERVVVGTAHVAALAAGDRSVVPTGPVGIGGIEGPRGGALVAQAVVQVGDAPRPQPRGRTQVL